MNAHLAQCRHYRLATAVWSVALAGLLTCVTAAHSATSTWDAGGGDRNWSTDANWQGDLAPSPASDTTVAFSGSHSGQALQPVQDIADPFELNRLEILTGSGTFSLSGSPLRFVADGATQPVLYSTRHSIGTLANDIVLPAGTTLNVNIVTYHLNLTGVISGEGGIDKSSSAGGIDLRNSANSFSGGLTIRANDSDWRKVNVTAGGAMGTGPVSLHGGTLDTSYTSPGGLIFMGTTSHANNVSLFADSPIFAGLPSGTANVTLNGNVDLGSHTLHLRGGGAGTIAGSLEGAGTIRKVDGGTWTLSGSNTYTGPTVLTDGTLSVSQLADGGSPSGIGQSSNAAGNLVFAGGTLRYTGGDAATDRRFTNQYNDSLEVTNAIFDVADAGTTLTFRSIQGSSFGGTDSVITKTGPGTLMFRRDGSGSTYLASIGAFVVEEGHLGTPSNAPVQLNVARLEASGPAISLGDGAELSVRTALQDLAPNTNQVVRYTGTTATAAISGGFTFSGPGGGGSNRKTFDVNDGTAGVDLHVSSSFGIYSGGGSNPPAVSDLWKTGAGTMRYGGNSSHRGRTVVAEGTLALSHASGNNIAASSGAEVHGGATLEVSGLADSTFQLANGQTLSGEGSVAGNVDLLSGTVLAPGMSAGTLQLDGNLTFDAGAFFDVDIEDADHADLVEMAGGTLTPGGAAIRVSLLDNFNPAIRDSWTILDGESAIAGDLFHPDVSVVQGSDFLASGRWFEVRYDNSVVLTVMPEPSAMLLAVLGGLALLLRRRRK